MSSALPAPVCFRSSRSKAVAPENPWRGEVQITVDGEAYVMRLTLGALVGLEAEVEAGWAARRRACRCRRAHRHFRDCGRADPCGAGGGAAAGPGLCAG